MLHSSIPSSNSLYHTVCCSPAVGVSAPCVVTSPAVVRCDEDQAPHREGQAPAGGTNAGAFDPSTQSTQSTRNNATRCHTATHYSALLLLLPSPTNPCIRVLSRRLHHWSAPLALPANPRLVQPKPRVRDNRNKPLWDCLIHSAF